MAHITHKINLALMLLAGIGFAEDIPAQAQSLTLGQGGNAALSGIATLTTAGTNASGTYTYDDGGSGTALSQQNNYSYWNTYGGSNAVISGGTVTTLSTYDASTVAISSGVGSLATYDASTANINAGILGGAQANGNSTINVTGGTIEYGNFNLFDSSTVNVSGGSIFNLEAESTSTVNVSGGNIRSLNSFGLGSVGGTGIVSISGGAIKDLNANATSTFDVTGGNIQNISTSDISTINLFGTGFTETLLQTHVLYQLYSVTGTLQNGDQLNANYSDYGGKLVFDAPAAVPEASTTVSFGLLLVLGMGGMVVAARKKTAAAA